MDLELEVLRAAWNEPPRTVIPAFQFRAEYRKQERWMRVRYVAGLGFAVALIGYAALVLRSNFRPEVLAWAVVVWVTTVGATAFSVWNWGGLWQAAGHSVGDYAVIYENRNRAMLRAMRFGYGFLALQLSISAPWLTLDFMRHEMTVSSYAAGVGSLALLTIAFLLWFKWSSRRAWLELRRVAEFRRGLQPVG